MILFAFFCANKSYEIDPFLSASKPYNIGEDPNSPTLVTKNVEKFISQPFFDNLASIQQSWRQSLSARKRFCILLYGC